MKEYVIIVDDQEVVDENKKNDNKFESDDEL